MNLLSPQIEAAKILAAKALEEGFLPNGLHAYTDEKGQILYWRIRLKHPDGRKWIRPMYQIANQYQLGEPPLLKDKYKPLYGLHLLAKKPTATVFIVEGEYPADFLQQFLDKNEKGNHYIVVTSGSASSADTADWQPLSDRNCIIWPDNDEPGERYAQQVRAILVALGCQIKTIDTNQLNLPQSGDCVDWIRMNSSRTLDDLLALDMQCHLDINHISNNDDDILSQLAALSPLEYDRIRITTAKSLNVRPSTLDKMLKALQNAAQDESNIPFVEVEPWPDPISPCQLLTEITETIQRFIVCQKEIATAATLWTAMTWFIDVIQVAPLAVVTAPEKRCGKSQLLFLLSRLVNRPLAASNITPAALFRSIDIWQPTLLIDEADTFMSDNEELRGLINCGHTRDSAFLLRTVGDEHIPKRFSLWGAKALAGIGKLSDTIIDRSILLELRRKKPDEKVERLRHADATLFGKLSAQLARFAQDYSDKVRCAKTSLPDTLNDRAQDNWEPLLAIAEIAGDKWSKLARAAALKISGDIEQSCSMSIELLKDIQEIIESKNADRIPTADLLTALCSDAEKPWATYYRGQSILPRQIANRLKEFGIVSQTIRLGDTTAKGYFFLQFADAFARYLPPISDANVTPSQINNDGVLGVT